MGRVVRAAWRESEPTFDVRIHTRKVSDTHRVASVPRVAASERIPSALASAHQASARASALEGKLGGGRKLPLVFPRERAL